jgi:hypothetical protein
LKLRRRESQSKKKEKEPPKKTHSFFAPKIEAQHLQGPVP